MIHREYFFDTVRASLFGGHLTQDQVDGLNAFLAYADDAGLDDREFAYILATTHHETAQTFQPIAEYGEGKGKPYGAPDPETGQCYYGRGYVQLTWRDNYARQDEKLALHGTLVANADRALEADVALLVICEGMRDGDFTGNKLGDFFTDEVSDFYNARTIVNGHDCATTIAGYATAFLCAIAHTAAEPPFLEGRS